MKTEELFRQKAQNNEEVFLLKTIGNKGDGLILEGTETLLRKQGIKVQKINQNSNFIRRYLTPFKFGEPKEAWKNYKLNASLKKNYPDGIRGKTLFINGCGGYGPIFDGIIDEIEPFFNVFEDVYILPSSFDLCNEKVKKFITTLPINVKIFARERYSHNSLEQNMKFRENLFMDDDMAFNMDFGKWKKPGQGVLYSMRTDEEKNDSSIIPKDVENNDVSVGIEFQWVSFLEEISKYEEVHTNRAHVAIAASMLDKKTFVYPNAYHKLKGIYEYSLKDRPNVTWKGE
ncbi:polysaccharide pyruvyl transferase family protein [Patescibacteria group bacterium]|nr:polysaccharide pyruvyl transferase family protein [Patescibacteria group bacterium]MBU1673867.1 polysaccharide pyruvyl transferase family protein [Patescibacteria group bacterium]MBU1963244.1 polysaccharide pyruvyl transferase family protein [Patescibacteria group bacterium]